MLKCPARFLFCELSLYHDEPFDAHVSAAGHRKGAGRPRRQAVRTHHDWTAGLGQGLGQVRPVSRKDGRRGKGLAGRSPPEEGDPRTPEETETEGSVWREGKAKAERMPTKASNTKPQSWVSQRKWTACSNLIFILHILPAF